MANQGALTALGFVRSLLIAGNTASATGGSIFGAFGEPWLSPPPARPEVPFGACRVTLGYGERVASKAIGMSLEFVDVSTDSRCLTDTQCPWTGAIDIELNLWLEGADLGGIHLTSTGGVGSAETVDDRFEIQLLEVRPAIRGEPTPQLDEYAIVLQVTELRDRLDTTVGPARASC